MNRETWHEPDPMLPHSRHQSMKALLKMADRPRPTARWWNRLLLTLDRIFWL